MAGVIAAEGMRLTEATEAASGARQPVDIEPKKKGREARGKVEARLESLARMYESNKEQRIEEVEVEEEETEIEQKKND